ncbi:MAG: hypothetical protein KDJ37_04035 [Hyphomicrobiaceae bacterium]|nr:hypothetical protein [Hyphomicrobiaceae bacterium]
MSETTSRRGRPKGTGIDDRATLEEIARLIAADPSLRPTTAIKAMGLTDPSVIRRLRDKYTLSTAAATNGSVDQSRPPASPSPAPVHAVVQAKAIADSGPAVEAASAAFLSRPDDNKPRASKAAAAASKAGRATRSGASERRPQVVAASRSDSGVRKSGPVPAEDAAPHTATKPTTRKKATAKPQTAAGKQGAGRTSVTPRDVATATDTHIPEPTKADRTVEAAATAIPVRLSQKECAAPAPEPRSVSSAHQPKPPARAKSRPRGKAPAELKSVAEVKAPLSAATELPATTPEITRAPAPIVENGAQVRTPTNTAPMSPQQLMMSLCGFGFAATNQAFAAQVSMASQFVKTPYVALALRQQLAMNEWAMGFISARKPPLKSTS